MIKAACEDYNIDHCYFTVQFSHATQLFILIKICYLPAIFFWASGEADWVNAATFWYSFWLISP